MHSTSFNQLIDVKYRTKRSTPFFKISIALMALRIRKKLLHHILCGHAVYKNRIMVTLSLKGGNGLNILL